MSDLDDLFGSIPVKKNNTPSKRFDPEAAKNNDIPPEAPTPEKRKAGRPRKTVKMVRVDTRLAPDDIEKVRRMCEKTGQSESGMLRELILAGLRSKNAR